MDIILTETVQTLVDLLRRNFVDETNIIFFGVIVQEQSTDNERLG